MFRVAHTIGLPGNSGYLEPGQVVTQDDLKGCDIARLVEIGALKPLGTDAMKIVKGKPKIEDLLDEVEELTETNSKSLDRIEHLEKCCKEHEESCIAKDIRIAELEKELLEADQKWQATNANLIQEQTRFSQSVEKITSLTEKIAELEKENKELKKAKK